MMLRFLVVTLCLFGCSHAPKNNVPAQTITDVEQVKEKYADYQAMASMAGDAYGFYGPHCDSLLFTALAAHAGLRADVFKAEKSPGEWQRHPAFDCYPGGESDSTISKDMLLGLLVYLGGTSDGGKASKRLLDYGKAHNYIMGSAKDEATKLSKTLMSAQLIRDYEHLADKLLGEEKPSGEHSGVKNGYAGHLDVLHIYASFLVYGGISDSELSLAKDYCLFSPRNALYCGLFHRFSDGDFSSIIPILLDEDLFPSDHLPTSSGRCSDYLWQRDDREEDWGPCPKEGKIHQGVDFLIAAKIVTATF